MKKKFLLTFLAAGLVLTSTPIYASDVHEVSKDEAEAGAEKDTIVTYNKDSDFIVSIPKNIALSSDKDAEYPILVKGSVLAAESVSVEPNDDLTDVDGINFIMSETNNRKTDIVANVIQEDTVWDYLDITEEGTVKNGSISAEDVSAGSWEGNLTFNINLNNEESGNTEEIPVALEAGLYDADGVMLCSWEDSGILPWLDFNENWADALSWDTSSYSGYTVLTEDYPTAVKIVIPDSITKIGDYAFTSCENITEIVIPDSVTSIGTYAFSNCTNLENITIPDSVNSIGNYAFRGVPHITYNGTATGSPWGATSIN